MEKKQKEKIENLYNFSNKSLNSIKEQKKIEKNKSRERAKRIKQRNTNQRDQFDFDTETVIGMTNKNNQQKRIQTQKKMTKKQAQILKKKKKKKKIKRILKFITLLLIIIGGIIFVLVSPIFNINTIKIVNNNQISAETIVSLSQLQNGQNIFRFNRNKVEDEIKTNPYIEDVKIQRKIPNEIIITVEEREKNFNIEFLNGFAYINNQGYILEISETKLELPVIKGILTEQEQIVEGNRLNIQDLEKLETVIQIVNICKSYEIDTKISSIDITNKNNYIIYMEEEMKTIYLGDENNLSNKMLYVPAIIEENKEKEGIIYVDGDINNNFKPRFKEKV